MQINTFITDVLSKQIESIHVLDNLVNCQNSIHNATQIQQNKLHEASPSTVT